MLSSLRVDEVVCVVGFTLRTLVTEPPDCSAFVALCFFDSGLGFGFALPLMMTVSQSCCMVPLSAGFFFFFLRQIKQITQIQQRK